MSMALSIKNSPRSLLQIRSLGPNALKYGSRLRVRVRFLKPFRALGFFAGSQGFSALQDLCLRVEALAFLRGLLAFLFSRVEFRFFGI